MPRTPTSSSGSSSFSTSNNPEQLSSTSFSINFATDDNDAFTTSQLRANVSGKLNYLKSAFDGTLALAKRLTDENRQLKVLVGVLLHFKHMFLFLKNSGRLLLEEELDELLGVDSVLFRADLRQCLTMVEQLVIEGGSGDGGTAVREFVLKRERYYDGHRKYCAFREEDFAGGGGSNGHKRRGDDLPPPRSRSRTRRNLQQTFEAHQEETTADEMSPSYPAISEGGEEEAASNVDEEEEEGDNSDDADFSPLDENTTRKWIRARTSTSTSTSTEFSRFRSTPKRSASAAAATDDSGFFTPGAKRFKRPSSSEPLKQPRWEEEEEGENGDHDGDEEDDELRCPVEDCEDSETTFARRADLNDHLQEVHGVSLSLTCLVEDCAAAFENRSQMIAHLKEHHPADAIIVCDLCDLRLTASDFDEHQCFSSDHHQMPETLEQQQQIQEHRCCWLDCQQTFSTPSELYSHAQQHVSSCAGLSTSSFRRFRCTHTDCGQQPYITENRSHLVRHIRSIHFGLPRTMKEQQMKHIQDARNPNDYVGLVVEGGGGTGDEEVTAPPSLLQYHCRWLDCDHHPFNCRPELRAHLEAEHVRRYVRRAVCRSCGYGSEHRNHVVRHVRVKHLGLPRSAKEQQEKGIVDDRNPADWMTVVEVEVEGPRRGKKTGTEEEGGGNNGGDNGGDVPETEDSPKQLNIEEPGDDGDDGENDDETM